MANNRLFLVHRPTGKAVFLGKRMSEGWYGVPDDVKERIENLFAVVFDYADESQDDFLLAAEETKKETSFVTTKWRYKEIKPSTQKLHELEFLW